MKSVIRVLMLPFLIALTGFAGWSQTRMAIDSVMITATRIQSGIRESGKSITLIKESDIAAMPVESIDDLLRYITGINVNTRNGFGVQTDIGMRGSTYSQVLILVDNIRINDPLTAHFNNNIPVSLSEIHQIEVIRGPAGTSYGPDAVGGIVHIKTKTYQAGLNSKDGIESRGKLGMGPYNLFSSDVGINARKGRLIVSAGYKQASSDGEPLVNPNFGLTPDADSLYNPYFNIRTFTASAAFLTSSGWNLYGRMGIDNRDFNAKYFYTGSIYDESTEQTDGIWTQFSLRKAVKKNHTEIATGYKKGHDLFVFNPDFASNKHTTEQLVFNVHHDFILNPKGRMALGSQSIWKGIESTDRGNHSHGSIGIYGIWSHWITNRLKSVTSLRLEYDAAFKTEWLPQLSIAYLGGIYTLRSSAGKSIRAADFTERYVSSEIADLSPGRNLGNPDLKAERAYSWDIGIDFHPGPDFNLSSTVFIRQSSNLIDYALTASSEILHAGNLIPGENYLYAKNITRIFTSGIEFHADQTIDYQDYGSVKLSVGYTWLNTRGLDGILTKYITNHPDQNLNLMVSGYSRHFNLAFNLNHIRRDAEVLEVINGNIKDAYTLANVSLKLMPVPEKAGVFFTIYNLFDTEYQEILGARLPGRLLTGGIFWNFQ